jgi:cysteine-S-conjugate beta-lyase
MADEGDSGRERKLATRLVRLGRDKSITGQFVNPPVVHASTVLFDSVDDMLLRRQRYVYGRRGTPTSEALESAVSELEGAEGTILCPSGLNAAATAMLSAVKAGERILIVDSVYSPVRHFADTVLKRLGVEPIYYDPALVEGIEPLFTANTSAVYLESPGSLTFEMQDLSAIAEIAHRHDAMVLFDNTWATPAFFRPLDRGADISIMAGTKYLAGHSDLMLGTVSANGEALRRLRETHGASGLHVGPDDVYLALRGLRTLGVRLPRHQQSATAIAAWLQERPEVARVLYPPLPTDPGQALWRRDMTGGSGLLGIVLSGWSESQAKIFVDSLELFGIGASWGGYESLAVLSHPEKYRTARGWSAEGPLLRLHIGLEDPDDLIADLAAAFAKATAAH